MKKKMLLLLLSLPCFIYGVTLSDKQGTTNYYGVAKSTREKDTPSTNDLVWTVTRVVTDANGVLVSVMQAYSGTGANAYEAIAWTNRYDAVYK